MIKFYLKSKELKIKDGAVYKELANEELDSLVVIVPFSEKLDISPYDFARLQIDNKNFHFVVDTYNEEQCDFDTLYNYTIMLVSETAVLDKIRMPNRKFTPRANRSVLWQCAEVLKYARKHYEIDFSQEFQEIYDNIVGVEKQFNKPTVREALNEILRINNSVVKVQNGLVYSVSLDKKNNSIDTSKLFTNVDSQNANDYASRIRIDAENCQSESNNVFNEILTFKTESGAVLTDENKVLITQHPIDEIYTMTVLLKNDGKYYRLGLVANGEGQHIKEKAIYDTLKIGTMTGSNYDKKIYNFYYTRHSNVIDGFNYNEKVLGLFDGLTALETVIGYYLTTDVGVEVKNIKWKDCVFEITYKSTTNVSFTKDKQNGLVNFAEITDGQIDNFINLDLFGKSEQEKVNRLGNKYKTITATYNNYDDIPKLFDYIDDYILADREITICDNYYLFKGILYKNYILESMFYGVRSKRRSYKIESGNKAVIREEIVKRKIKLTTDFSPISNNITRYLLMPLTANNFPATPQPDGFGGEDQWREINNRKIMSSRVVSNFENGDTSSINRLIPYLSICGDSLLVKLSWFDNYSAGLRRTGENAIGGESMKYARYVDDNGELTSLDIKLYDYEIENRKTNTYAESALKLPYVSESNNSYYFKEDYLVDEVVLSFQKDSQEIPNVVFQYDFIESKNVVVGEEFYRTLLKKYKTEYSYGDYYFIAYSTSTKYKKGDQKITDDSIKITDGSVEIDYTDLKNYILNGVAFNSIKLYNNNVDTTEWKSWAICSYSGELVLGVNRDESGQLSNTIYLDVKGEE